MDVIVLHLAWKQLNRHCILVLYCLVRVLRGFPLMQLGLADRDSQSKQNANDMEKYCLSFIWFFFYFRVNYKIVNAQLAIRCPLT